MRVPYDTMVAEFNRVLLKYKMEPEKALKAAHLFADASRDGVYTHGLNRFPRFISYIEQGAVDVNAEPELVAEFGALARYDGKSGPGNLNAAFCADKAMELADKYGVGVVAIGNTNHWMRPGAFGLQAAEKGYMAILWTNTTPNLPAWGSDEARLGNNPIVFAVPSRQGIVLLDVAMSMFSYGKIEQYMRAGKPLPVAGGYDTKGELTTDASEIWQTNRALPIGYWKGSGMSLMLDLFASVLSGGRNVHKIGELPQEAELCQLFMMINMDAFGDREAMLDKIDDTLNYVAASHPAAEGIKVRWPGQGMKRTRDDNMANGIPVDEEIWNSVLKM